MIKRHRRASGGFTLMELMVALTIFSMMAVASWRILDQLIESTDRQSQASTRLLEIQLAVQMLDQDINNHIDLDIFDEFGERQGAISSREIPYQLSLSRYAWFDSNSNSDSGPLSAIQRVSYELREREESTESYDLIRKSWHYPNRTNQTPYIEQRVLSNLLRMDLQFITRDNQLLEEWPPLENDVEFSQTELMAINLSFEMADYPSITRLYVLEPAWSRDEIGI